MSEKVGAKTKLTDELFKEIKRSILDGNDLKETAKICEINEGTFYVWHSNNYLNLADKIDGWKRDRKLMLADITSDIIQTLPVFDDNGKLDKELLKIKQKEAEFIRETLGKQHYSKRSELTGKDGEAIIVNQEDKSKTDNIINEYLNAKQDTGDIKQ
ncbi:MAG TPA: hypothetical protein PKK32_01440 [Candidatus Paceibacterota bacterium]|nr:hypothetical protein [Candidatus Paceibacterota bacterium]